MSGIQIDVNAKTSQAERNLDSINRSIQGIEKTTTNTSRSIGRMVAGLASVATVGLTLNYVKNVSNEFTNLSNRLATVTGRTDDLVKVQKQLLKISEDTRGSIDGSVKTFQAFGRALKSQGVPLQKMAEATKTVQQSIALSGASAESANAAIIQLGQGLAAGQLRGEELNSVLEQAPRIAQAIADEIGTGVGQLRGLAQEGALTTDVVFNAMLNQAEKINNEFKELAPTIGQAQSLMSDSVRLYVFELDKGLGLTKRITESTLRWQRRIREAANDAENLGLRIRNRFNGIVAGMASIIKPIGNIIYQIGRQFQRALPEAFFQRTLKRDLRNSIIAFDQASGGLLSRVKNWKRSVAGFFRFDTEVEAAIRQFRRLSPSRWVGAGFNVPTFERFFSTETLTNYSNALTDLGRAIGNNFNTIGGQTESFTNTMDRKLRQFIGYFDLTNDAIFVFQKGVSEDLFTTLTEIVRGLANVGIKVYEIGRLFTEATAPATQLFADALGRAFRRIPSIILGMVSGVDGALGSLLDMLRDTGNSFFDIWGRAGRTFDRAFEPLRTAFEEALEMAERVLGRIGRVISKFGEAVKDVFSDIYDAVIGNSYWTDMIEAIIETSQNLWKSTRNGILGFFKNFSNAAKLGTTELLSHISGVAVLVHKHSGDIIGALQGINDLLESKFGFRFKYLDDIFKNIVDQVQAQMGAVGRAVQGSNNIIARSFSRMAGVVGGVLKQIGSVGLVFKTLFDASAVLTFYASTEVTFRDLFEIISDLARGAISFKEAFTSSVEVSALLVEKYFSKILNQFGIYTRVQREAIAGAVGLTTVLIPGMQAFGAAASGAIYAASEYWSTWDRIVFRTRLAIDDALDAMLDFKDTVIEYFAEIYDKVIGNSYWTDMIESVVDTSTSLWGRVSGGLETFRKNTLRVFSNTFDFVRNLELDFSSIKGFKISLSEIKLPEISADSIGDTMIAAFERVKKFAVDMFDSFPSILKVALYGLGTFFAASMFPPGPIKAAVITALSTGIITSASIIAEEFGAALTGGSVAYQLGRFFGTIGGQFATAVVKELPKLLNALGGIISGFIRGFAEQIPIIGTLISGVFGVAGAFGLQGPLGLFGLYFFGPKIFKIFDTFGLFEKKIKGIKTLVEKLTKFAGGNGVISTFLFGKLGGVRLAAITGTILSQAGALDSLFGNSQLTQLALEGGMLYLAFAGKDGLNKIKALGVEKILTPLGNKLKGFSKGVFKGTDIYEVFFGGGNMFDTGASKFTTRLKRFLLRSYENVRKGVINFAAPIIDRSYSFLKAIFLGSDGERTAKSILDVYKSLYNSIKGQIAKFLTTVKDSNIMQRIFGTFGGIGGGIGGGARGAGASVGKVFDQVKTKMTDVGRHAERVAGKQGLLGRIFLGKAGKIAAITSILALVAGIAQADDGGGELPTASVFDDLENNFNNLVFENPMAQVVTAIVGVSIPAIILALTKFRAQTGRLLASAFKVKDVEGFTGQVTARMKSLVKNMKGFGVAAAAGLTGAFVAHATGNDDMAIVGGIMAAELGFAFRKQILSMGARVFAALGGVLFLKIAAIVAAIAAVGGLIYQFFFGKKGEFFKGIGDAIRKVGEFFGIIDEAKSSTTGLSESLQDFINQEGITLDYNLSRVDQDNITERTQKSLEEALGNLTKALEKARKEQTQTGLVSQATRSEIAAQEAIVSKVVDKARSETAAFGTADIQEFVKGLQQFTPDSRAGEIVASSRQKELDLAYDFNSLILRLDRFFARDPEVKADRTRKLNQLQEERNTRYNATFRGDLDPRVEQIGAAFAEIEAFEKLPADLAEEIGLLGAAFKNSQSAVQEYESRFNVFNREFRDAAKGSQLSNQAAVDAQGLLNALQLALDFQYAQKRINDFNEELSETETRFESVGISFQKADLRGVGADAYEQLQLLSDEAERLGKLLENVSDADELSAVLARLDTVETKTQRVFADAKVSGQRKQFKLQEVANSLGIGWITDGTFEQMTDASAEKYYQSLVGLQRRMEDLQKKFQAGGQVIGAKHGNPGALGATLGISANNYEAERLAIVNEIKAQEQLLIRDLQGNLSLTNDAVSAAGFDLSELTKYFSFEEIEGKMAEFISLNAQLELAMKSGNKVAFQYATEGIAQLKKELSQIPSNISEIIGNASSFGQSFSVQDLAIPGALEAFNSMNEKVKEANELMLKFGDDINEQNIGEIIRLQAEAAQQAFDQFLMTVHSTGEGMKQAFSQFGFNTPEAILALPQGVRQQLLEWHKEILQINQDLKDRDKVDVFDQLLQRQLEINSKAKELKQIYEGFDSILGRVNKQLGLNLSEEDFANLTEDQRSKLIELSGQYDAQIKELKKAFTGQEPVKVAEGAMKPIADKAASVGSAMAEGANKLVEGGKEFVAKTTEAVGVMGTLASTFADRARSRFEAQREVNTGEGALQNRLAENQFSTADKLVSDITGIKGLNEFGDALSKLERADLIDLANGADEIAQLIVDKNYGLPVDPAAIKDATDLLKQNIIYALQDTQGVNFALEQQFKDAGQSVSEADLNKLSDASADAVQNILGRIQEQMLILDDPNSSRASLQAAQHIKEGLEYQLSEYMAEASRNPSVEAMEKIKEAGSGMMSNIQSAFGDSMKSFLRGESDLEDLGHSLLDNLSNSILDGFANNLTEAFTGEDSIIGQFTDNLGQSIASGNYGGLFNFGGGGNEVQVADAGGESPVEGQATSIFSGLIEKSGSFLSDFGTKIGDFFSGTPAQGLFDTITKFGGKLFEGIGSIFGGGGGGGFGGGLASGLGGLAGSMLANAIFGATGGMATAGGFQHLATGGLLRGPGTGTSDDIMAFLSNGEFVVNAKATKKHLKLLNAINQNQIPRFAEGGIAGAETLGSAQAIPTEKLNSKTGGKGKQTVVNLSINGDISRQTRSEVYRMLPQIASGVNIHNKEKGIQ